MIAFLLRGVLVAALPAVLPPAAAQGAEDAAAQPAPRSERTVKDPRSRARVHTELGALYFQNGNIPVAMEELTVAIHIDPGYGPAYGMRALVHHFLKEPVHAEDNFRAALRHAPDDPEIANNYGWFLCQNERGKEAMPQFERALRNPLYPTPERAHLNAGQCALRMGQLDLARGYLNEAYRLSGGNPVVLVQLAGLDYRAGFFDAARARLVELAGRTEPDAEALWLGVRIERRLGNRESEMSYAAQLRRRFPASKEYQEMLKGNYE